jgi:hydroxyacyl-ACP dehydratase HTD2-like protein with hotdog domain
MTMALDIDHLKSWVGRQEVTEDAVTPVPVAALSATLDRDDPRPRPGDPLPPLWHWLYFLPLHRQSEIGPDGHARRGGFLPPVPLPRRMWAGGRFDFRRPLRVGEAIRRTSTIADVTHKAGRTGPLVFVLVRHEVAGEDGGPALVEEHDIVYREAPAPGEAAANAIDAEVRSIVDGTLERTIALLRERRDILDRGSRRLLEKETLDEAELAQLAGRPAAPAAERPAAE